MMQSRTAPDCKNGDVIRDYEATVNFAAACTMPRNPSSLDHLQGLSSKNARSVQAPAGSVMAGEVVINADQQDSASLSAGFIAVMCICGIIILFLFVYSSEIKSSISSWLRCRQRFTAASDRRDVHGDPSRAARPESHDAEFSNPNPSEAVSSNGSSAVASAATGMNDSPATGWKRGVAYWVIKGLPLIKYKKQKLVQLPITSFNSASSIEYLHSQNLYQHGTDLMVAPAGTFDHDIESAQLPAHDTLHNDAAPDYTRLECVVCLSPFEDDEAVKVLPQCFHAFHAVCIDSWLLLHSTCPLCRAQVSSPDGYQE